MTQQAGDTGNASGEERKRSTKPIRLTGWQRFGAILGGSCLLGAGGWGYIASGHDGAGTVAFVTAGTIAGLLGVVGRVPTKLTGKDYGLEMAEEVEERVQAEVAEIVDDLPTAAKQELANSSEANLYVSGTRAARTASVGQLNEINRVEFASSAAAKSLAFQKQILQSVQTALADLQIPASISGDDPDYRGLDAVVTLWESIRIGLEVKTRPLSPDELNSQAGELWRRFGGALDFIVLVTEQGTALGQANGSVSMNGFPTIGHLRWVLGLIRDKVGR